MKIFEVKYSTNSGFDYVYYYKEYPNIFYRSYLDCRERKNALTDTFLLGKLREAVNRHFNG